jgi:hypothetical protein
LSIVGPSISAIDASPWLVKTGLPIGITGNRGNKYSARPRTGSVIAWCLGLEDVLNLERRSDFDRLVLIRGYKEHAPWITAHDAEFLGGEPVAKIPEASGPIKAMVDGLSVLPVLNQGLIDSRERSMAVQALTTMRHLGHKLDPNQLVVEAIRNEWPGTSPLDLADLAKKINAGKQLRFQKRLNPDAIREWDSA